MTDRLKLLISLTAIITLTIMIVCRPLARGAEVSNTLLGIRSYQSARHLRIVADVIGQPQIKTVLQFNQLHAYQMSETQARDQQVQVTKSALQNWTATTDKNHNTNIEFKFDRPVQLENEFWLKPDGITKSWRLVWDFKLLR